MVKNAILAKIKMRKRYQIQPLMIAIYNVIIIIFLLIICYQYQRQLVSLRIVAS